MIFTILTGPPGCGKTDHLLRTIVDRPGRHLVVAPRTALLDEHTARLRHLAKIAGASVATHSVHSGQSRRGGVLRRLESMLREHATSQHVVVLATHEALLAIDPSLLVGWHVGLDELPDASVASGRFSASTTWSSLERQYRLEPWAEDQWWRVMPRDNVDPHSLGEVTRGAPDQVAFHRLITRGRPVCVDIPDWEQARLPCRQVGWWSIWTLAELSGCASVTLTGASFSSSLFGQVHQRLHAAAVACQEQRVGAEYPRARPLIRIHFYTRHHGSTTWWETDQGSRCLIDISRHLERTGFTGYWSCNESSKLAFLHRLAGPWCKPKQAGTNNLRHHMACAYLYSNKPQDADLPILDVLGLDRVAINQAREYEDIFQFVMRGAIRTPDYSGTYDVYLYDEGQALALQARLLESGVTDQAELIPVEEAGLLDVVRPQGRSSRARAPTDPRTMQEHREQEKERERQRGRRRRHIAAEQRQRDGTARKRGRPPKAK